MNISLKSALKAPLNRKFSLIVGLLGITFLLTEILSPASLFKGVIPAVPFSPIVTDILILFITLGVQLFAAGYLLNFAYNRAHSKTSLFENLSIKHVFWGLKSILFNLTLGCVIILMFIPVMLIMSLINPQVGSMLFVVSVISLFFLALVCWTKFIDTRRISEPLRFPSTYYLLSNAWRQYLKIIGNSILAFLIMIVPIFILNVLTSLSMIFLPVTVYASVFVIAFTTLYPLFVFTHIMAQGYAGIKTDLKAKWVAKAKAAKTQTTSTTDTSDKTVEKNSASKTEKSAEIQPAKPKKITSKGKVILPEGAQKTMTARPICKPISKKSTAQKKKG